MATTPLSVQDARRAPLPTAICVILTSTRRSATEPSERVCELRTQRVAARRIPFLGPLQAISQRIVYFNITRHGTIPRLGSYSGHTLDRRARTVPRDFRGPLKWQSVNRRIIRQKRHATLRPTAIPRPSFRYVPRLARSRSSRNASRRSPTAMIRRFHRLWTGMSRTMRARRAKR